MKQIVDKIVGWLNSIPADKYKHFAVGAVLAAVVLLAGALILPKWAALVASVAIVAMAAIVKERFDDRSDRSDIFATSLGGLVVWIVYLIG